ncbi:hypothetical protein ACFL6R_01220 [Gemmatimonadota bacterium]
MSRRRTILSGAVVLGITIPIVILLLVRRGPELLDLSVGTHKLSVIHPYGFEVVEQDDGLLFRDGLAAVALSDLGPREPGQEEDLSFEDWVELEMRDLGYTVQREISRRDSLEVQGRTFQIIETWDRLSHDHPYRYAFALNGEALLVLYTRPGDLSRATQVWENILQTIAFRDP